ncbi:sirohydrochlorin cobaltochelatase, putative [Syntrophotalea carbinolica DSM 2380]|uniref:Sirohydrochlorin cobaltochelatase, putative n=1 Tax=Syntrophotalea carbinolica (strain DSM 2380 / NBRC 103641 / GraBd1) TaxID=338963 RepID=Q3A7A6_SYNC1|nr:sirohydrochlorin cobaltochelatase [Syntrophotalea carbinolica]ABA87738.2 sirohydrochlorin cobaltochelatase, putative [Syntrophotalea carbinolica DSM 2380]
MSHLSRIIVCLLLFALCGCAMKESGTTVEKDTTMNQKSPAIVLVAFGTTSDKGRQVFDVIEQAARRRYPDHDIFLAFTSQTVVDRLHKRGIQVRNLEETLAVLQAQGYRQAVLQSLMIVPGQKDAEISQVPTGTLQATYGQALMATPEDIRAVAAAVNEDIAADRPTVFVTHGNSKHPRYNQALLAFAATIEAQSDSTFTCSVEGQPGLAKLPKARMQAEKAGAVHFVPLMLVAGDHIENDVLGDEPDSWKSLIGVPEASCSQPLGYNAGIRDIFFRHLDTAMTALQAVEG